jgi:hypothetical protein
MNGGPIAATISISSAIPGVTNVSTAGPAGWVSSFYTFALLISGILAFGAIVFGGIKYAVSAGNPSKQSEGRSWIWGALIGLLLLGVAWLILHTVNPNLTNLQLAPLTPISAPTNNSASSGAVTCGGTVNAACPNGQTCTNQGTTLAPSYACVNNTTFNCGQPSTQSGACPSGETCINGATSANAPPHYYCST